MSPEPRILVVFGTRPEAIKLAPVIAALRRAGCTVVVCATAQHRQMLDQVLALFEIRCDHDLDLMRANQSLPQLTSSVLTAIAPVIDAERPDLVIVQGDTTTAMAAALASFYAGVPVAHVEAGLRSDDLAAPWPEEMNRRVVSTLATLHLAPTEQARRRLEAERVPAGAIAVTGNTVIDALLGTVARLDVDPDLRARVTAVVPRLDPARRTILLTSHRRESFGRGLENICRAVRRIADRGDVQVVYPVHLNQNVKEPVHRLLGDHPHVHLIEPLDYLSFVFLLRHAALALTDSGGVQEEAPSLGKPVLVMRDTTERPEGIEAGVARLVGTGTDSIVAAVSELLDDPAAYDRMARSVNPYGDGHAAERVATFIRQWWSARAAETPVAAGVS
jgi:UDP-N-acetylglucosamine 2-epimerase